jgi:phosphonate transport system permease protein
VRSKSVEKTGLRGVNQPRLFESRRVLTLILAAALTWSLLNVGWSDGVLHAGGLAALREMGGALLTPDLSGEVLGKLIGSVWRTLAYAFAGLSLALVIGFPLGLIASGVLRSDGGARDPFRWAARLLLAFLRSVHELVWAWLFVAAVGLFPMAAVLALALPYSGILGRVFAELFQDVPHGPLRALRSAGASETQVFWHGRLPFVLSDALSYTFYRLECGIRSATVLSFVGLGGLGFHIQIALADLAYARAWTFVLGLIVMIVLVEAWSSAIRRRVTS